jgi:alkaline phosphatase
LLKKILFKKWVLGIFIFFLLLGSFNGTCANQNQTPIRNVILLIGDGMGFPYPTAYRYFKNDLFAMPMKPTKLDPYLIGSQTTYSADTRENITDSAAAATAMATGIKTYNGAIGVDLNKTKIETVLERAKKLGKSTGLAVTSKITDATPAGFAAHTDSRKNTDVIANNYYDERIDGNHKVDVLIGGGIRDFIRNDRDLIEEFKKDGYSYVTNKDDLKKNQNAHLIGLFSQDSLPKMIDRSEAIPSLKEMTRTSIELLNRNKNGFFLMVEGSQIDIAGHDNDIVAAMSEMEDFVQAFKEAIDFASRDKNTLVVATADHTTGGFTVGANHIYKWDPTPIKHARRTPEFMAMEISQGKDIKEVLQKYIQFPLNDEEIKTIKNTDKLSIAKAIRKIFDTRTHTGWTTNGHTGEDVPVYGFGPGREMFRGLNDNTCIAKNIFQILNRGHK